MTDAVGAAIRGVLAVDSIDPRDRFPEARRALVVAQGERAVPVLLEIIAEAIAEPGPHHGLDRYVAGNAATVLADLNVTQAIEPLLSLLEVVHADDCECASDVMWALGRFGREAVEATLARYARAEDRDVRDRLVASLSGSRVRDDRIFEAIVRIFDWDDELAASLLLDYGDPRAIPYFVDLLEAPQIEPALLEIGAEASLHWDLPLSPSAAARVREQAVEHARFEARERPTNPA